jgi:hypothetical protein
LSEDLFTVKEFLNVLDGLARFPIIKIIYLVGGQIISTIFIVVIAIFTQQKSTILPLWLVLLIFFLSFLFLSPSYYLCQGVFAIKFGGKNYCGMLIGLTDGGSYIGSMIFSFFVGDIIGGITYFNCRIGLGSFLLVHFNFWNCGVDHFIIIFDT